MKNVSVVNDLRMKTIEASRFRKEQTCQPSTTGKNIQRKGGRRLTSKGSIIFLRSFSQPALPMDLQSKHQPLNQSHSTLAIELMNEAFLLFHCVQNLFTMYYAIIMHYNKYDLQRRSEIIIVGTKTVKRTSNDGHRNRHHNYLRWDLQ